MLYVYDKILSRIKFYFFLVNYKSSRINFKTILKDIYFNISHNNVT